MLSSNKGYFYEKERRLSFSSWPFKERAPCNVKRVSVGCGVMLVTLIEVNKLLSVLKLFNVRESLTAHFDYLPITLLLMS